MIMKRISILCLLICVLMNSCQTNLDGNCIVVKNAYYQRDTVDSYGIPTFGIKYFSIEKDNVGNENIEITYNNNYIETLRVLEKITDSGTIHYTLEDSKTLSVFKKDNSVLFTANSYARIYNYEIVSISQISQQEVVSTPSFSEIMSYKRQGEAKDNVRYITNRVYCQKEMFGIDSLIYRGCHNTQYDIYGNLIYEYAEDYAKYNNNANENGLLFSRSLTYDKNNHLVSERRDNRKGTLIVQYKSSENKQNETILYYNNLTKNYPIAIRENRYTTDFQLKETEFREYWSYDNTYHLDHKIIYKNNSYDDNIYGIVYDHNGTEKRKIIYNKDLSPIEGIIEFGEYGEYSDPFNTYKENFSSDAIRKLTIKKNRLNTIISLKYPWKDYGDPVFNRFVSNDEITYDSNFNPIKRVVTIYDKSYENPVSTDEYVITYKYDQYGNWIVRHSVLTSHKRNGKVEKFPWKGFVEFRDIEYNEHQLNSDNTLFNELKDYESHIATLKNEHWTIRIDLMKNGSYRYASWKNKATSNEPNIVLYTGTESAIKQLGSDRHLIFYNNEYSYEVTWADYNPNYDEESYRWELIVKQDEKVILSLSN